MKDINLDDGGSDGRGRKRKALGKLCKNEIA